ncbi:MAG: DinB family protein [Balneolaceae bacterium]|nr:DinB family protein [Balneolaceae bacterium]
MVFSLSKSLEILERTPIVLRHLLGDLSEEWLHENEGPKTWSPYEVLGHLIEGEKTDWMVRLRIILSDNPDKTFEPFDRFAHLNKETNPSVSVLLEEFEALRTQNLAELKALALSNQDLDKTGIHPEFGAVTIRELLSSWVVHDLGHIAQISRVMAKQYSTEVGLWVKYMRILD